MRKTKRKEVDFMLQVYDTKTEYRTTPLGIDAMSPRFSWKLKSDLENVMQRAYRIRCYCEEEEVWDSGRVEADTSNGVIYNGNELKSRERIYWTVTVETDTEEAASEASWFEMGLLKPTDWKAQWIEPEDNIDFMVMNPSPCLRRCFTVRPGLKRARIYQTSHGLYQFWINGYEGTTDKFMPGLTSYHHRIQYQTYDITNLLKEGENVWAAALGDGWWRGIVGGTARNNFGYKLQYLGQIMLTYEDGTEEIIATDESFKTASGGLLLNDMKAGNIYDAAKEPFGWKQTGFDDRNWKHVHTVSGQYCDISLLIPSRSVPVREKENFRADVIRDANGDLVLDFGQNIAGYVKCTFRGCRKGQEIILVHGEDMKDGVFSVENICMDGMLAEDRIQQINYISDGKAEEHYTPMFSVFGFRYVKVSGYDGDIREDDFVAVAVYSDLEETGDFYCSNPLINQLVSNCRWSQKGNFLDVPTDCPQRERSPWTGDSQVYARTAADYMNVYPFFEKWMQDLNEEQLKNGKICNTVPATNTNQNPQEVARKRRELEATGADMNNIFVLAALSDMENGGALDGSAGWSDMATIVPYTMYLCYGDRQILENQYDAAKKHVEYMLSCAKKANPNRADAPEYHHKTDGFLDADSVYDVNYHWGEWLEADRSIAYELTKMGEKFTNPDPEVPTAFMCYSTGLLSKMASILGKTEDAGTYAQIHQRIKAVFNRYFIPESGVIKEGRQAPNVRALAFDLCDDDKRKLLAEKLNDMILENDCHLNTGFLATPYILPVLTDMGYTDTAYHLLEQETKPSWLYNVKLGATTILEEWCGMETHTGSYNHYSAGAVSDFLFTRVCGIMPVMEQPGYKKFLLKPIAGGSLTEARAEFESPYGRIISEWKKTENEITYSFTVPANTTAEIILPGMPPKSVGSGNYTITMPVR